MASPPLASTPARRLRGHSRDVPAKMASTSDSVVPSRVRNLNAESNVQSRITQFQRNVDVSATRALSIPSTKGQPLVLGPSQATTVGTSTPSNPPSQLHSSAVDKSVIDRLDSIQRFFDQSLQRALHENSSQFKSLQAQIQNVSGSISQLQEHILEVDEHCRRNDERLDAWEIQDASEYAQELELVHEAEGENEYEDDQTDTTHDPGDLVHGLHSVFFGVVLLQKYSLL